MVSCLLCVSCVSRVRSHVLDSEFFMNHMSLMIKQAYPQQVHQKVKKAILEVTVKSQRIGTTLKLEIIGVIDG